MNGAVTVTLVGYPGQVPTLETTPKGKKVTRFRLATTERVKTREGEWVDAPTVWWTVEAWEAHAQAIIDAVRTTKTPLVVVGRIKAQEWDEDDGQTRRRQWVSADSVGVVIRPKTTPASRTEPGVAAPPVGSGDPSEFDADTAWPAS